jgi:broad specificity phosphatase PhoE
MKQSAESRQLTEFNINNAVFLLRHGECLSNRTWPMENYTDEIDVLTCEGREQVKRAANYFHRFSCNFKLISSTLTRAKESADILKSLLKISNVFDPDERIVEKNHEEPISCFRDRIDSFFRERIDSPGPWIVVCHGHVIETLLVEKIGAPYNIEERADGTYGIRGISGVANGAISCLMAGNFVFFNHVQP